MESITTQPSTLDAAAAVAVASLDEATTLKSLAALAQTQRLRAFRALVVAGPNGLTPGAMAEQLAVAPSALSFHLKELAYSGLVTSEARGRNLIYRASIAQMNGLLRYLTEHCCGGQPCDVDTGAVASCVVCT
jgi:ArsR family transcriptional regulator, arsenate/arsenite/antimonite-responsive transcriptional repressor